jgi:ABC-type multidrug transport system permease subunit
VQVFYREIAARTYSFMPYSLAEATIELPYLLVQGVVFTIVLYWLVDFPSTAANVFIFMLAVILNNASFTFVGEFMVHVTPNVQLASVLASGVMGLWKLFSGAPTGSV